MNRILLTGMSGTGKSTITAELAARGFKAVDLDSDAYSHSIETTESDTVEPNRDWVWLEDRVQQLLSTEAADALFVSGCAPNMSQFLPQFNHIILLSAPPDVILERLATRTTNTYGKDHDEAARVLDLIATIEPRLRRIAHHEVNTAAPLNDTIITILRLTRQTNTNAK